jgi:hypothetical protein
MALNDNYLQDSFQGLGTYTKVIPMTGVYAVSGTITLRTLTEGHGTLESQLVVTINQNGTPVYVGAQAAKGFKINCNCATGDIITIVLSSSASADQPPNVIRSSIAISQEF